MSTLRTQIAVALMPQRMEAKSRMAESHTLLAETAQVAAAQAVVAADALIAALGEDADKAAPPAANPPPGSLNREFGFSMDASKEPRQVFWHRHFHLQERRHAEYRQDAVRKIDAMKAEIERLKAENAPKPVGESREPSGHPPLPDFAHAGMRIAVSVLKDDNEALRERLIRLEDSLLVRNKTIDSLRSSLAEAQAKLLSAHKTTWRVFEFDFPDFGGDGCPLKIRLRAGMTGSCDMLVDWFEASLPEGCSPTGWRMGHRKQVKG